MFSALIRWENQYIDMQSTAHLFPWAVLTAFMIVRVWFRWKIIPVITIEKSGFTRGDFVRSVVSHESEWTPRRQRSLRGNAFFRGGVGGGCGGRGFYRHTRQEETCVFTFTHKNTNRPPLCLAAPVLSLTAVLHVQNTPEIHTLVSKPWDVDLRKHHRPPPLKKAGSKFTGSWGAAIFPCCYCC